MCTDKNITAKLDILMPPSILLNVDSRFKLTIPSGKFPLDIHIVVKEKVMNEYDVSVIATYYINLPTYSYLPTMHVVAIMIWLA